MAAKRRVSFAPSAITNLEEIRSWYADQQVLEVGERLVREIVDAVLRLADFPESGRVVPEFGLVQLREIIHPPFRIVYRLDDERVRVVRVWRSERLMTLP
jgi:plasmid stabilization system protein ParE